MKHEHLNRREVLEKITPVIENVSGRHGLLPLEVDFVKESGRWFLRIFIYSYDHAISHKDCEDLSRGLNEYLEQLIPVNYYLEISSPGAERKLKSSREYQIFTGKKAKVKLKQPLGEKEDRVIFGKILGYDSRGFLNFELAETNHEIQIEESNISSVRLCLD